jgi:hypothetical protein
MIQTTVSIAQIYTDHFCEASSLKSYGESGILHYVIWKNSSVIQLKDAPFFYRDNIIGQNHVKEIRLFVGKNKKAREPVINYLFHNTGILLCIQRLDSTGNLVQRDSLLYDDHYIARNAMFFNSNGLCRKDTFIYQRDGRIHEIKPLFSNLINDSGQRIIFTYNPVDHTFLSEIYVNNTTRSNEIVTYLVRTDDFPGKILQTTRTDNNNGVEQFSFFEYGISGNSCLIHGFEVHSQQVYVLPVIKMIFNKNHELEKKISTGKKIRPVETNTYTAEGLLQKTIIYEFDKRNKRSDLKYEYEYKYY